MKRTAMIVAAGISLAGAAQGASDIFLKFGEVKGESTDPHHPAVVLNVTATEPAPCATRFCTEVSLEKTGGGEGAVVFRASVSGPSYTAAAAAPMVALAVVSGRALPGKGGVDDVSGLAFDHVVINGPAQGQVAFTSAEVLGLAGAIGDAAGDQALDLALADAGAYGFIAPACPNER